MYKRLHLLTILKTPCFFVCFFKQLITIVKKIGRLVKGINYFKPLGDKAFSTIVHGRLYFA